MHKTILALAATAALIPAQRADLADSLKLDPGRAKLAAKIKMPELIPFHREDEHGVWGMGKYFKVGIRPDGTCEVHVKSKDSWRWKTRSIRVGKRVLVDEQSKFATQLGPRRVSLDYGLVRERYDLGRHAVEQSWVIDKMPQGTGDLRIESTIAGMTARKAQTGFEFVDGKGRACVSYGVATAVDAAQRRTQLSTEKTETGLAIVVPESVWKNASYPLVIDPLIGPTVIARRNRFFLFSYVARDPVSNVVFVAASLLSSSGVDAMLFSMPDSLSSPALVFARINPIGSFATALTCVASQRRVCMAFAEPTAAHNTMKVYIHDSRDRRLLSGVTLDMPQPYQMFHWQQFTTRFSGCSSPTSGRHALLAYVVDRYPNQARIECVAIDVAARRIDRVFVPPLPTWTGNSIALTPMAASASDPWILGSEDNVVRVWHYGASSRSHNLGLPHSPMYSLAGQRGRYLSSRQLLSWPSSASAPTVVRRLDVPAYELISFDWTTRSHWATTTGQRYGYDGRLVEAARLPWTMHQSLCFDSGNQRFLISDAGADTLRIYRLVHDSRTSNDNFGSPCGMRIFANQLPYAGSEFYRIQGAHAPPGRLSLLFVSTRARTQAGAIGICPLLLDLRNLITVRVARADSRGNLSLPFPLPSQPGIRRTVFFQWVNYVRQETSDLLRARIYP